MAMTLFQDCEPIFVFSILGGEGRGGEWVVNVKCPVLGTSVFS